MSCPFANGISERRTAKQSFANPERGRKADWLFAPIEDRPQRKSSKKKKLCGGV
jgi:hypothetical protein